jgi:thioester reductase-like protein
VSGLLSFVEKRDKAWARLAKALATLWREESANDGEGYAAHVAREEADCAKQALRDLGVDVDQLLEDE